ncbi:MAG: hypothetical protein RLZZ12_1019 [Actinomycetota bacterium]|jgi:succinate dehydrogenase hydrophobic anchor subunit
MIAAIFIQVLFLGLLFFGAYKLFSRGGRRGSGEFSIRRLFHYSLLYFSVIVAGVGVSGLLGRTLDFGQVIAESRTDLARNLSFAIVGVPLVYLFARWSSKNLRDDSTERSSLAWQAYLTITSITSLVIALYGLHDTLSWSIGNDPYRGDAISQLLVWSIIWIFHLRLSAQSGEANRAQYLIGSGIGLSILAVGLGGVIANSLEALINTNKEVISIARTNPIVNSSITVLLGAPVWIIYWLRGALTFTRDFLWHAYIFLAGIAASFITTVVGFSVVLYDILVWIFGDTGNQTATQHFFTSANALGAALSGLAIWSYHRALIQEESDRTELRRIYEYIVTGVSLIAASLGILMIIVAAIESVTPSDIASASEGTNALVLAMTLLIVGAPFWWGFWNRIERAVLKDQSDLSSPTRRIYLLMLFGVAGVATVISLITAIFLFFDDLLNSELAQSTFRDMRFAIGILITNAAISGYHWTIYKSERDTPVEIFRRGRHITLVGPSDSHIVQLLKEQLGGNVQLWVSPDSGSPWNLQELVDLIDTTEGEELLVINEKRKLRAIQIHH